MVPTRGKWMLVLLSSIYMVGELGHYLIGVVSRSVAQELYYGDKACLKDPNVVSNASARFCEDLNSSNTCDLTLGCVWNYNGLGLEYQWLAGPSYIVAFTISGIFWGIAADSFNRVALLTVGTVIFSIGIAASAFVTKYWQLMVLRALLAIGEAACSPLAAGMISDVFLPKQRALAMSLFNWGIYIGYGLSYAVGNYVTEADILGYAWRPTFLISGIPGFIVAALFFMTVKDPSKDSVTKITASVEAAGVKYDESNDSPSKKPLENRNMREDDDEQSCEEEELGYLAAWKSCLSPIVLLLVIASCIRHTGGYTWGYNSALYFQTYYPEYDAAWWLTCISIFGGAAGSAVGGYVADKLVTRLGVAARALVLATSQLLATPFTIGLLYLEPPYAFFSLLVGYIVAEMWFGVMFVIFVELVPTRLSSTAIGVTLFVINNVGGNLPVLVAPASDIWNLRTAITVFYPGALITSSLLFFICCLVLRDNKQ